MSDNPLETYFQEADELLEDVEQSALSLGVSEPHEETIHRLFRSFHTIKGSGAMLGLEAVAGFTHHIENLLDRVRGGRVPITPKLVELVLQSSDQIRGLLSSAQTGAPVRPETGCSLVLAIEKMASPETAARAPEQNAPAAIAGGAPEGCERTWLIEFAPDPSLLLRGVSPLALLQEVQALGICTVEAHTQAIPALDAIRPDLCYLSWSITLRTSASEDAIRDVFVFVEDDSKLKIRQMGDGAPEAPVPTISPAPEGTGDCNRPQAPEFHLPKAVAKEATVRVPSERLDRLVNLVGELVMNQSRLSQAVSQNGAAEFANPVQELERLVAELRDNVLGIRMLPIGTLFGRFPRLVHDLSAELGKEADLLTEGVETELDKSILDQLGEPLVHCLRNCLDHGIEPPEQRIAKGKPRRSVIRLSAQHTGSDVVIRIGDDGRGIDRQEVRKKAVEKQLIAADAVLSDQEIIHLILLPGFSTARQVTAISGRGVGMDAVKQRIESLRGSLAITSEEGKGTDVSITLPLTLAIIDGLLVQIAEDQFILPLAAVTENVELLSVEKSRHNERNVIAVRGELVPYIDLRSTFRTAGCAPAVEKVVIVQQEGERVGLVVDRVLGTHQTVIQSLGRFFKGIEVVSGATIMGDGKVALIMDIAAVVRRANRQCQPARRAHRAA